MKIRHAVAISSIVFGTAFAGIASANISTGSLGTDVQSAIGSGTVTVFLSDGVATLVGNVEARTDSVAAESAALNFSGVDSVINHISVN
jgi:hypothetical protein